jgi:hypothetical protein
MTRKKQNMPMISLRISLYRVAGCALRVAGYKFRVFSHLSFFGFQVSGVRCQQADGGRQKSEKAFHLPGFFPPIFCHLTSTLNPLFIPETLTLKPDTSAAGEQPAAD